MYGTYEAKASYVQRNDEGHLGGSVIPHDAM